jgi:tetratricopeptide (TPR) repeat protein
MKTSPHIRLSYLRIAAALVVMALASSVCAQTAQIQQGRAAVNRGENDAAIAILEKAVAQYPNSADAQFALSVAYGSKAQQSGILAMASYGPKAKAACEKAVALNPRHVEARFGLVQFYTMAPAMMGGSHETAFEQAKEIKAIDPLMGHRAYAFIYAQQKKLDLAKKEYTEAIREQPDSAKAHTYLGQYLANVEKNYSAAYAALQAAMKVDSSHMPAVYHLGRVAALGGINLPSGEEALKKYLAYTPKEDEPTLASAHYYLGSIYEKTGKKLEAQQSYEATLKLNRTHKQATEALKRVS